MLFGAGASARGCPRRGTPEHGAFPRDMHVGWFTALNATGGTPFRPGPRQRPDKGNPVQALHGRERAPHLHAPKLIEMTPLGVSNLSAPSLHGATIRPPRLPTLVTQLAHGTRRGGLDVSILIATPCSLCLTLVAHDGAPPDGSPALDTELDPSNQPRNWCRQRAGLVRVRSDGRDLGTS